MRRRVDGEGEGEEKGEGGGWRVRVEGEGEGEDHPVPWGFGRRGCPVPLSSPLRRERYSPCTDRKTHASHQP
jgi:hypothetical protein